MAQLSAQRNVRRNLGWRSLEPIGTPCAWLLLSKFAKYPTEVKTCFTIHLRWFKGKEKHLKFKSESPAAIYQLCLTNFYHELIITHYNHYMQRHVPQIGQFDQLHFWKTKLVYSNLSIATLYLWYTGCYTIEPQKKTPTFHYTGWLIGILILAYCNPYLTYITGWYNPL